MQCGVMPCLYMVCVPMLQARRVAGYHYIGRDARYGPVLLPWRWDAGLPGSRGDGVPVCHATTTQPVMGRCPHG